MASQCNEMIRLVVILHHDADERAIFANQLGHQRGIQWNPSILTLYLSSALPAGSASGTDRPVADGNPPELPEQSPTLAPANLRSLGLLFGLVYFLQTIADPLEGLSTQPTRAPAQIIARKPSEHRDFYGPPFAAVDA